MYRCMWICGVCGVCMCVWICVVYMWQMHAYVCMYVVYMCVHVCGVHAHVCSCEHVVCVMFACICGVCMCMWICVECVLRMHAYVCMYGVNMYVHVSMWCVCVVFACSCIDTRLHLNSLCCWGWTWTSDLLPASSSPVLGSQVYITTLVVGMFAFWDLSQRVADLELRSSWCPDPPLSAHKGMENFHPCKTPSMRDFRSFFLTAQIASNQDVLQHRRGSIDGGMSLKWDFMWC